MKAKNIEELFGTLQQSVVAEWRKHLKTSKYSKHMALDEFYKEMPEKIDALIESYMGGDKKKVDDYKNVLKAEDLNALQYLEELLDMCEDARDILFKDEADKSNLDDVINMIKQTAYKVRELDEHVQMKSLKDFLNESMMNEAKRLSSYSDEELFKEFWNEWSGLTNGAGGTSGNPRASKLANFIGGKYDWNAVDRLIKIDDMVRDEMKDKLSGGSRRIDVMKDAQMMQPEVLNKIMINLDYLMTGKGSLK